jgi:hypothetical protein
LDDVVAVAVFDASEDVFLELLHHSCLMLDKNVFQSL